MSDYDTITAFNPQEEDFMVRFNGEPYTLKAGEERAWPVFIVYHIAKHLSDRMLQGELQKLIKKTATENPFNPLVGQLMVYDNPKRRIALYQILKSKEHVEACLNAFPFKGFIGEVAEYDDYVTAQQPKTEKKVAPEKPEKAQPKE